MSGVHFSPTALAGKVVVVVGASGGIGRAVATAAARTGAKLLLTGRTPTALESTRRDLFTFGRTPDDVEVLSADLLQESAAPAVVGRAIERFGRIDGVVNAAGVGRFGAFDASPIDDHWSQVETNVGAAMRLAHAAVGGLKATRGRFVQVVSGLAHTPRRQAAVYGATQHALRGLIHGLRLEYGAAGVRFSLVSVAGAGVDTGFWGEAMPTVDRATMMEPAQVAEGVVFSLVSEAPLHVDDLRLRTV